MTDRMSAAEYRKMLSEAKGAGKNWGTATQAKRTVCGGYHSHASKMEARVCDRLRGEIQDGERLIQQARVPLWSIAPEIGDRPHYLSVDFIIVRDGKMHRAIDAKSPTRVSRDWKRGALAFEACYGIKIEETNQ